MSQILNRIEREMKHRKRSRGQVLARRVSLVFLLISIPVLLGEIALRLANYSRPQISFSAQRELLQEAVASLNQRLQTDAFTFDPHLLWKLQPGSNLLGLQADPQGLLTWERSTESGPRKITPLTVLCLGDSVSAITYRTFPQIAENLAKTGVSTRPIRFVNAAVPGYTTEQALRKLEDLRKTVPDVVILCFGWNDHFPALSLPDKELGASNAIAEKLHDLVRNIRLYQLVGAPLGSPLTKPEQASATFRVNPVQFQANLDELIATVRSWNAIPVLATQPQNLSEAAEQYLSGNRFMAPEGRDNQRIHAQYNKIVRDTAAANQIPLLDVDEEFLRRPRDYMLEADGIHLTGRGHNHVARLILNMLKNEALLTPAEYDAIARAEKHDTTAPDKPRVTWSLSPAAVSAYAEQNFRFSVIPQNSGNTRWLKEHVIPQYGNTQKASYGSSYVFARWRTVDSPTTGIAARAPIPSDILPGEATSITLTLQSPARPGNYEVEIGIAADQIGPLSLYGAETTTLTVTSLPPQ